MNSAPLNIDKLSVVWYYSNALAVTEDRATQECDLSAGYGVSGKSDAIDRDRSSFFVRTLPLFPETLRR